MVNLSAEAQDVLFGDDMIKRQLAACKSHFEGGDRSALFEVLELCACYQAVIPEWAADEILAARNQLKHREINDFNQLFGWSPPHRTSARRNARLNRITPAVINAIFQARASGASFNSDETFGEIASNLKISRRDVESIYKANPFLREIPQHCDPQIIHGYAHIASPAPRRRGRGILKDSE